MIHETKPEEFNPRFEVVSCFIEVNGKILILHRQDHKPEGDKWGCPAGKVDEGEELQEALKREVYEETEIALQSPKHHHKLYVKYPDYDFIYHIFHEKMKELPKINLREEEHKDYQWLSPEEALKTELLLDEDECIKLFFGIT
jgi:8-oxo-dGTP pyrophosphatase MutT (NUDIX family)